MYTTDSLEYKSLRNPVNPHTHYRNWYRPQLLSLWNSTFCAAVLAWFTGHLSDHLNVLLSFILPIIHSRGPSFWKSLFLSFLSSFPWGQHPLPRLQSAPPRQLVSSVNMRMHVRKVLASELRLKGHVGFGVTGLRYVYVCWLAYVASISTKSLCLSLRANINELKRVKTFPIHTWYMFTK